MLSSQTEQRQPQRDKWMIMRAFLTENAQATFLTSGLLQAPSANLASWHQLAE